MLPAQAGTRCGSHFSYFGTLTSVMAVSKHLPWLAAPRTASEVGHVLLEGADVVIGAEAPTGVGVSGDHVLLTAVKSCASNNPIRRS